MNFARMNLTYLQLVIVQPHYFSIIGISFSTTAHLYLSEVISSILSVIFAVIQATFKLLDLNLLNSLHLKA